MLKKIIALFSALLALIIPSAENNYIPNDTDIMLIDCYDAVVGTVGGDRYDEMTVTRVSESEARIDVYHGADGMDEQHSEYIVSSQVIYDAYEAIYEYDIASWLGKNYCGALDGRCMVCKYYDGSDYIRVTSDDMPDDGKNAFYAISSAISAYIDY